MSSISNSPQDEFPVSNETFDNDSPNDDGSFGGRTSPSNRSYMVPLVLTAGIATTIIFLVLRFLIVAFADFDVMLITMFRIIPVGAFLVGIAAGCGYGLGARFLQFFPSRQFILTILVIQLGMFLAGRYTEYLLSTLTVQNPPGFFEVYREHMEGFVWQGDDRQGPVPLGKFGYFLEFATATLFAIGSLVGLGIMHGIPYCRQCRVFMRNDLTIDIPASSKRRKVKKKDLAGKEQLDQENAQAIEEAAKTVAKLVESLVKNDTYRGSEVQDFLVTNVQQTLAVPPKEVTQYWRTMKFTLARCPQCDNFHLEVQLHCVTGQQDKTAPPITFAPHIVYRDNEFQILEGFDATADENETADTETV